MIYLCDYRLWSWDFAGSSVLIPEMAEGHWSQKLLALLKTTITGWMNLPFSMLLHFVNVHDRRPEDTGVFDGKRLFQASLI